MMRRAMTVVAVLLGCSASAQAISGTLSANFVGFNEFGQATTHLQVNLACALSCPSSAPTLSYSAAFIEGFFIAEPLQNVGYVSYGFLTAIGPSGTASTDSTSFPPGSNFLIKATSVTCQCGGRTGEGGYIGLSSGVVNIPPWINVPEAPFKVGEFLFLTVAATPRVSETVDVTVKGAGIDFTRSFPASDFVSNNSTPTSSTKALDVAPTQPGTVTVTAAVTGGPVATKTFEVLASGAGGGSGGGASASGGGAGGGSEPAGCAAVPALLPLGAILWLALRRRARAP